jgi:prepilin-type N-terminal cleavage/methylation domain
MAPLKQHRGYSLLELIMVMGLGATLTAAAVPQYLAGLDEARARGAAHHVSGQLQRARMEAVKRSAMVGVQFTQSVDGGYSYAVYLDGNRNGVLTRDIQRGIDPIIAVTERLSDQFPGVEFGAVPVRRRSIPAGRRLERSHPIGIGQYRQLLRRGHRDIRNDLHPRPARRAVRGLHLRRNRQDAHVETRFTNAAMETVMRDSSPDRRGARRLDAFEEHRIVSACVRPGHRARLIDVSSRGALIETNHRLLPARTSNSTSRTEPIARAFEDVSSGAPWSGCVRRGSAIAAPLRSIAICRGSLTNAGKLLPRR